MLDLAAAIAAMRNGAVGMKPVYAPPLVVDRPPAEMGMAPSVGVYPSYTPYDQAVRDQTAAEDAYQRQLSQAPPMAEVIRPVTPALRSHDLLAGAVPAAILALLGRGRDAAQYLGGYWGGKQQRAESDNQFAQAQSQARNAAAMNAYNQSNQLAQFKLGRADRNLARVTAEENAKIAAAKESQLAQGKARTAVLALVDKLMTQMETEQHSSSRTGLAQQAMNLLAQVADDPGAEMRANLIQSRFPELQKPTTLDQYESLRNRTAQTLLGQMDEDHRLKIQNIQGQIKAREDELRRAQGSQDLAWWKEYKSLLQDEIQLSQDQLNRWTGLFKAGLLTNGETVLPAMEQRLQDLKSKLSNLKLPERSAPDAGPQANASTSTSDYAPVNPGAPGFSINRLEGPIGPGGSKNVAPQFKSSKTIAGEKKLKEEDAKKKKATDQRDKDWQEARKKIVDLRAKVTTARDKEAEGKIAGLRAQLAGETSEGEIKRLKAEIASWEESARKSKSDIQSELQYWIDRAESIRPGSIRGKAKTEFGPTWLLKQAQDAVKKTGTKTTPKNNSSFAAIRLEAINAIKQGRDAEGVRRKFKELTGKDADF